MTENKRYYRDFSGDCGTIIKDRTTDEEVFEFGISDSKDLCNLLNEQEERIQELESENTMLKVTIGRNEAYINRLTNNGKWSNTSSGGNDD